MDKERSLEEFIIVIVIVIMIMFRIVSCSHKNQTSIPVNRSAYRDKSSKTKFTTTTCSTSLPLLAMVSTMSGKAVEARLGVGGEGRRNLSDVRRSASSHYH